MEETKVTTYKMLRNYLVKNGDRLRPRRRCPEQEALRVRLDDVLLAFRVARKTAGSDGTGHGWLRAVRQATGVPVYVLAKRLGATKYEVFRLEKMERESRIILANLERAATALDCELVYALVPKAGSLEDLAAGERKAQEAAVAMARRDEEKKADEVNEWLDMPALGRRLVRHELRKMGIRVR